MPSNLTNYAFYLPDIFAAGSECFPSNASSFQEFQLRLARESARNVSLRIPWKSAWGLLAKAPGLGFKVETFASVGKQLVSEHVQAWRRVSRLHDEQVCSLLLARLRIKFPFQPRL
jgi:hypothetical protein